MKTVLFWFRRDLRLTDNHGLFEALKNNTNVLPIFIFDPSILETFENKQDRRVDYIHQALEKIQSTLLENGSSLEVIHAKPLEAFALLVEKHNVAKVICNHDYEPTAIERDAMTGVFLNSKNISFESYKDQVLYEKNDILKPDGLPYSIYTPFSKKWKLALLENGIPNYPSEDFIHHFQKTKPVQLPSLKSLGYQKTDILFNDIELPNEIISNYETFRDYPAKDHTTHLGIALRFGTISPRICIAYAQKHNETWLSQLIWREFFMQILYHYPRVVRQSFKLKYENIEWLNDEKLFQNWCNGQTGYALVDAGMRELNTTGFMHNRVRMLVASFLTKHLLIDWRWGELYFAQKLNDYDLALNNGNWQWSAGCGCDSAPYFRIFNPDEQLKKFDKKFEYTRKWVPEIDSFDYQERIVEHTFARTRALETYKKGLNNEI